MSDNVLMQVHIRHQTDRGSPTPTRLPGTAWPQEINVGTSFPEGGPFYLEKLSNPAETTPPGLARREVCILNGSAKEGQGNA